MFKTLLKKQLYQLNQSFFYDSKKGKARSKVSSIGYIVFFAVIMIGVLGGMFTYFSLVLCNGLVGIGYGWLYFAISAMTAVMMGVFGSVFNTYASLYQAKDNDLLLSMPIPVRQIMLVRLLGVYLMGLLYSAVIITPAVVVYWIRGSHSFFAVLGGLLLIAEVSVIVLVLSCILGLAVAKASTKLKNKSIVTTVLSLAFLAAYYYVYANAYTLLQSVITNAAVIGEKVRGAAYPVYILGKAGEGDAVSVLSAFLVCGALLALTYYVMEKSFLKIATSTGKVSRKEYRAKRTKSKSADHALFSKEMSRFLSSPTYMLNCALGTIIIPAGGIAFLVKGNYLTELFGEALGEQKGFLFVAAAALVCLLSTMNYTTAPSVSLEGKTHWLSCSLPVSSWQILRSKLMLHLALTVIPSVFCSVCLCAVLRPSVPECLFIIVMPVIFTVFYAAFGLVINLKSPNLNWTNETAAVKQSLGILVTLFAGWIFAVAVALCGYFLTKKINALAFLVLASAVMTAAAVLLLVWLRKKGTKIYESL